MPSCTPTARSASAATRASCLPQRRTSVIVAPTNKSAGLIACGRACPSAPRRDPLPTGSPGATSTSRLSSAAPVTTRPSTCTNKERRMDSTSGSSGTGNDTTETRNPPPIPHEEAEHSPGKEKPGVWAGLGKSDERFAETQATCKTRIAVATMSWAVRPHILSISAGVLADFGMRLTNICSRVKPSPDCVSASAMAEPRPPP